MATTCSPSWSTGVSPRSSSARSRSSSSATGTAANALALAAYAQPGGVAFCHREAHVIADEPGSAELFGGAAPGRARRRRRQDRPGDARPGDRALARGQHAQRPAGRGQPHPAHRARRRLPARRDRRARRGRQAARPRAPHGRRALCRRACRPRRFAGRPDLAGRRRRHVLRRHQERLPGGRGGRLLRSGARPNGFAIARQRAGHTFSKSWFVAAQFDAYLDDGHWLDLARGANACRPPLADAVAQMPRGTAGCATRTATRSSRSSRRASTIASRAAGAVYHPWSVESLRRDERPRFGRSRSCAWSRASAPRPRTSTASRRRCSAKK